MDAAVAIQMQAVAEGATPASPEDEDEDDEEQA